MTKAELIDAVKASRNVPEDVSKKAVQAIVEEAFEQVKSAVKKDDRFSFPGFGTFTKKKRAARMGRNPQTGEAIKIKAQTSVGFRPAQDLKDFVSGTKK
ncbi:MAG TPA: HU family DNA-binding protein [Polyangia bacterium]|nr:HU family DNA-binding protein [Polyangia bacterium]